MKKILCLLFVYLICLSSSFAKDLRFAQITDVRYSKANNSTILKDTIKEINKQKDIDFVVFTGDNIQRPDKKDLEGFIKEAKHLKKPFYVIIGDKEVNKYKNLSKKEYMTYLKKNVRTYKKEDMNYIAEKGGVAFFFVDGSKDVIPSTNGYFKDDVMEWLDSNLALYSKKNVVIFQHFPLIPPTNNESYMTLKSDRYLDILKKHPNVKAVISGHFGVNKEETVDGIVHITTAPLPTYRVIDIINATSKEPSFWAEVREIQ